MNRLLGYLVTFLLIFGVVDGVFRLAGCSPKPVRVEFEDSRGWQNLQGTETTSEGKEFDVAVRFNSHRMRGPEFDDAKAPDTTRVLVVGDSFTLGYTVEDHDLFLRILERELQANGHKIEVLNAGTEAYSTDQQLAWFEAHGKDLEPDYVVLAPYLNDIYWNSQPKYMHKPKVQYAVDGASLKRVSGKLENTGARPWFEANTGVGTFIGTIKGVIRGWAHQVDHEGRKVLLENAPLLTNPPVEIDRAWEVTEALVAEFAEQVRAAGAKPVALLVPNKWEIDADSPINVLGLGDGATRDDMSPSAPTDRFAKACRDAGFDVVDPRAGLKTGSMNDPVYFAHDWHWNERGNKIVAAALLEHFEKPGLLGAGNGKVTAATLISEIKDDAEPSGGVPLWVWIVGALWLLLGFAYTRSYPSENPVFALLKVGALIAFVVGVVLGVAKLADALPPSIGPWVTPLVVFLLLGFILVKAGRRLGIIGELYGTFLRRGHWYMLPMLVVMLSIGMLLVVAASSPFVAPFIYTLF